MILLLKVKNKEIFPMKHFDIKILTNRVVQKAEKTSLFYFLSRKSNRKMLCFCLILMPMICSCSTPRMFTTLDILQPAEVTFLPQVQNVLIVNNAPTQPYDWGHYDFNNYGSQPVGTFLRFDSAAIFCAASLRENLEAKEFFNSVSMSQTNANMSGKFDIITPLSNETVLFLCNLYKTDAVISLDQIKTYDYLTKYTDEGVSSLDVKIETRWSIHYPYDTLQMAKSFTDEFSWEENNYKKLPNRYDALVDACILTGSNVADRMIPRWEKQDRYFFAPKKPLFQQAMDSVTHRNWTAAIRLWSQAADETKSNSLKMQAMNNIAIAYEILGDLDNAILFAEKAAKFYPQITTFSDSGNEELLDAIHYYELLKQRKQEIKILDKQLNN